MKTPKIKGIKFDGITIKFKKPVARHDYDLGGVYFECEGRKFALDVVQSYSQDPCKHINCDLEVDTEEMPIEEHLYDLKKEDFNNPNLTIKMYCGGGYVLDEIKSIKLYYYVNDDLKSIEVGIDY